MLTRLLIATVLGLVAFASQASDLNPEASGNSGRLYSAAVLVPFATSSASFRPDAGAQELLAMAPAAVAIYVRGRTSTTKGSAKDERLAAMRALAARAYLVAHGVSPLKVNVNFASAADYIVDNTTAEGQRKNQRVEIEMVFMGEQAQGVKAYERQVMNDCMQYQHP